MPRPAEKPVQDLKGFMEEIKTLKMASAENRLFFRGCSDARYKLIPGLYRRNSATSSLDVAILEQRLLGEFRQRSIPFHSRTLDQDWDALFFMQHYGIPTRLLDWTENPLIAMYFAVVNAPPTTMKRGKPEFDNAAVWVLDPAGWNRFALRNQGFKDGVLDISHAHLMNFKPSSDFKNMNKNAVAIYGAHNSQRIVAQRGVFTVFGQGEEPMEEAFDQDGFPAYCLAKLIMDKDVVSELRREVIDYGITDSVVFPDLDGLSREIKRRFGFSI